jgi:hypothetical protein
MELRGLITDHESDWRNGATNDEVKEKGSR